MVIALGYILTFGWVFLVLGRTAALKKKRNLGDEASRKIVHVAVAFAWIPMALCFGASWHAVVPPAVFIVLNAISYRRGTFGAMERADTGKRSLGTVYYAVSMTVMAAWTAFLPECLPAYGTGLFCMALGDGLAPLFGSIRKGNRRLFGGRTLYGCAAVALAGLTVTAVMAAVFALPLTFWQMLAIAAAGALLELAGVRGYDNLTLPLGVFLLTFFFTMGSL